MISVADNLALALTIIGGVWIRTSYARKFDYKVLDFCKTRRTLKEIKLEVNKNLTSFRRLGIIDVYILMQNLEEDGYINFITHYSNKTPEFIGMARHVIYPCFYITIKDKPLKKKKYKKSKANKFKETFLPNPV